MDFKKKQPKHVIQYEKDLADFSGESLLKCNYIFGIPQLIKYTSCLLVANKGKIKIVTLDSPKTEIHLQYAKIIEFKYMKDLIYYLNGGAPITRNNGFAVIRYQLEKKYTDIFLALPFRDFDDFHYNEFALKDNNIFSYVNKRIVKKGDTIIEL